MTLEAVTSLYDLETLSREVLEPDVWDFVAGGSGQEIALRANRHALDAVSVVPRVLTGANVADVGTRLLRTDAAMPVAVASMAYQGLLHPNAELETTAAAAAEGVPFVVSTMSSRTVKDIARTGATLWFQLYWLRDTDRVRDLVRRAEDAGCEALVITADVPVMARRLRDIRNDFTLPAHVSAAHLQCDRAHVSTGGSAIARHTAQAFESGLSWEHVRRLREWTELPIVVKGVLDPRDAVMAASCGADAVVVSNHGGRQFDAAPAACDRLEAVVKAVGEDCEVLFDSGVRGGNDVVRVLALGARGVFVGRPVLWGLTFGVQVMIAANRWADIRPAIKDMLGTRFELRLGDPSESDIDRRVAVNVPAGRPGRGLTRDKLHMLTALPRVDGSSDAEDVGAGVADAVAKIKAAWRGRPAPQVRLLPEEISYEDVLVIDKRRDSRLIPIGVNEDELAPVYLDFDQDPHFYAFADGESGKTNLLRQIVRSITERYTPKEAVIILVDFRRTMFGFIEGERLLGYAVQAAQLDAMMKDVANSMKKRLPGPDVTQEQLKTRSWWKGPDLFVIVDDYDLVVTSTNNPLKPVSDFLAQAKDVGLHIVAVRRTGGASRAMFDPILGKLKEIAAPGMVMNGSRDEGMLIGTAKPGPMPPGRGFIHSRKFGKQLMQVSWIAPE